MSPLDPVSFHVEGDLKFQFEKELSYNSWLQSVALEEGSKIRELNYIFMTDEELLQMNIEYLSHDTYTDVITFDNSESEEFITGDIFISVERVQENAKTFNTIFENELSRVMVHGLLHLLGYEDKSDDDLKNMRSLEDKYLQLLD